MCAGMGADPVAEEEGGKGGNVEVEVNELQDEDSVKNALRSTLQAEKLVEGELESFLGSVVDGSRDRIKRLEQLSVKAKEIQENADELKFLVRDASKLSESVSARFRHLDAAYSRCESALLRVEDVIALRGCAEGVRSALAASDLEAACTHVARYLQLGESAKGELDTESGTMASVSRIKESIEQLQAAIRDKTDQSTKTESVQEVVDTVRLFVPIGLSQEGLERLGEYLKYSVHRESTEDMRTLLIEETEKDGEEPHVTCLTRLFETIAAYMDDIENMVVEHFGAVALVSVAEKLQKQCDAEGVRILSRYLQERQLDEVARLINNRSADARDLDVILDEQAIISQRTSRYFRFLSGRVAQVLNAQRQKNAEISGTPTQKDLVSPILSPMMSPIKSPTISPKRSAPQWRNSKTSLAKQAKEASLLDAAQHQFNAELRDCDLQRTVDDLTTRYINMEAYFMQENVLKAIRIDEAPLPGSAAKTSTAVDDVFFIVQKCVHRAVSYGNIVALCAVINYVNLAISSELLDFIKRRLGETERLLDKVTAAPGDAINARLLAEPSGRGDEGKPSYRYTVAVNNAHLSSEFTVRLRNDIEKRSADSFTASRDHAQINAVLAQLSESSRAFASTTEEGLDRLVSSLVGRLGSVSDAISQVSYYLEEEEYQDKERGDRFMRAFIMNIDKQALGDLEKYLSESNWDGVVRRLAEWSAKSMEEALLGSSGKNAKRLNALGALQLDRDVRALSTSFASRSRRGTVRDVFARLSQISMLVNFEKPSEVYDLWGPNAGGMTWRLTPTEVRNALALRADFNTDVIRSLRL